MTSKDKASYGSSPPCTGRCVSSSCVPTVSPPTIQFTIATIELWHMRAHFFLADARRTADPFLKCQPSIQLTMESDCRGDVWEILAELMADTYQTADGNSQKSGRYSFARTRLHSLFNLLQEIYTFTPQFTTRNNCTSDFGEIPDELKSAAHRTAGRDSQKSVCCSMDYRNDSRVSSTASHFRWPLILGVVTWCSGTVQLNWNFFWEVPVQPNSAAHHTAGRLSQKSVYNSIYYRKWL